MEYTMEELLPVTVWLTEKYTSKESSSVTYETAQMLMEAVIYCIKECTGPHSLRTEGKINCRTAYDLGYEKVLEKVCDAKKIYDRLSLDFQDYGCVNYRETILEGMPRFFLYYNSRFCPQDHLLTLDYPSLGSQDDLRGVDRIYEYLQDISVEKQLLECFAPFQVTGLLRNLQERHHSPYMGNLCEMVLLTALGCMIAEKPIAQLTLSGEDMEEIHKYFAGDSRQRIEDKLGFLLNILLEKAGLSQIRRHFEETLHGYAVRMENACRFHTVTDVFFG